HQALRLNPFDPAIFGIYAPLALAHLLLGQYEEGLRWVEESLRENIGIPGLRAKLSLCGHLGRLIQANECLRQLREIHPEPTIANLSRSSATSLMPEVAAALIEGWRKAGVPDE